MVFRGICVSDHRAKTVVTTMELVAVIVMKTLNSKGDIFTSSVPHIDINGTTNEYAIPKAQLAASRPMNAGRAINVRSRGEEELMWRPIRP